MKRLHSLPLLALTTLLFTGCSSFGDRQDEKQLANIEYTVRAMYEGHERTVTISPAGEVVIVEQMQDVIHPRIISEITADERSQLISAFQGWKKLKNTYVVDVSPQIMIKYGDYAVTTSSVDAVPEPYKRAKNILDKIAITLAMQAASQQRAQTSPATNPSGMPAIPANQ